MRNRNIQIRKALMGPDKVRQAIQKQKQSTPIFFMENEMVFEVLTENIAVGHKQRSMIHANNILKASIREDVELHGAFVQIINELRA
ncbi:MAG: hypothetical protein ACXACY_19205 [Candidatus Hodarchaeales archaeon]|jgi:hypothetical protein